MRANSRARLLVLMCPLAGGVFAQSPANRKILDESKKKDRVVEGKPVISAQPPGTINDEAKKKDREVIAFPLVCRGGKGIRFKLFATAVGGKIWVSFLPGNGPASAGLLPGHCSWQDRGLREGEPLKICHDVPSFEVSFAAEASSVTVAWSRLTFTHDLSGNYLADLRLDSTFTFNVFNDGNGCLKVFSPP